MSDAILDASALLAFANREVGYEEVREFIGSAAISAINLSEVVARLADRGLPQEEVRETLQGLGLEVVPFEEEHAYLTGMLRSATRPFGLSLGDRACLALAHTLGLPAITADRRWLELPGLQDRVRVIR